MVPLFALDPITIRSLLQEVAGFLLAFAAEFRVCADTKRKWINYIIEHQDTTLGTLARIHLTAFTIGLPRPEDSQWNWSQARDDWNSPAITRAVHYVWSQLNPECREDPETSGERRYEEATWQLLAGWIGVILIQAYPGNADSRCFPPPIRAYSNWRFCDELIAGGEVEMPRRFRSILAQVLEEVEQVRRSGNFPILDQDLHEILWLGEDQATAPFRLSAVLQNTLIQGTHPDKRRKTS